MWAALSMAMVPSPVAPGKIQHIDREPIQSSSYGLLDLGFLVHLFPSAAIEAGIGRWRTAARRCELSVLTGGGQVILGVIVGYGGLIVQRNR